MPELDIKGPSECGKWGEGGRWGPRSAEAEVDWFYTGLGAGMGGGCAGGW